MDIGEWILEGQLTPALDALEAVMKLHHEDHYLGEPGDADCPHDADYEGPRHFLGEDDFYLCEDTPSEESFCAGCPVGWDGERADWPCETVRVIAEALGVNP